jgi:hypothetical protein
VRLAILAIVTAAGCGRLGFEASENTAREDALGDSGDLPGDSDSMSDGDGASATCAGGDGVCRLSCVAVDPDCTTTCNDGRCVGNAGELCSSCPSDCNTQAVVCGNGACDPGEDSDLCYADCGPSPWPWVSDETQLLGRINQARTQGINCPGAPTPVVGALTMSPTIQVASREWSWEIAHQGLTGDNACNGRSLPNRAFAAGANFVLYALGPTTTVDQAADFWLADGQACQAIMNGSRTTIGVAVAHDTMPNAYVILMN